MYIARNVKLGFSQAMAIIRRLAAGGNVRKTFSLSALLWVCAGWFASRLSSNCWPKHSVIGQQLWEQTQSTLPSKLLAFSRKGQGDEDTGSHPYSPPLRPLYKHMNNSWRLPSDFLPSCDDFSTEGVPANHPMNLHLLFGSNASESIDANETARLLHGAADYQLLLEDRKVEVPPMFQCRQAPNPLLLAPRNPRIGGKSCILSQFCVLCDIQKAYHA